MPLIPIAVVQEGLSEQAGVPPVTPFAWFDPSITSSLTYRSDGRVQIVNDLTDGGRNLTGGQSVPAVPLLAGRNGERRMLEFDGTGTTFFDSTINGSDNTWSAFLVVALGSFTNYRTVYDAGSAGNQWLVEINARNTTAKNGTAFLFTQTNATLGAWVPVVIGQIFVGGSTVTHYVNFTSQTGATGTSFSGSGNLRIGAGAAGANPWIGLMGEILMYDTALSATDAQSVVAYLKNRWNVQ